MCFAPGTFPRFISCMTQTLSFWGFSFSLSNVFFGILCPASPPPHPLQGRALAVSLQQSYYLSDPLFPPSFFLSEPDSCFGTSLGLFIFRLPSLPHLAVYRSSTSAIFPVHSRLETPFPALSLFSWLLFILLCGIVPSPSTSNHFVFPVSLRFFMPLSCSQPFVNPGLPSSRMILLIGASRSPFPLFSPLFSEGLLMFSYAVPVQPCFVLRIFFPPS